MKCSLCHEPRPDKLICKLCFCCWFKKSSLVKKKKLLGTQKELVIFSQFLNRLCAVLYMPRLNFPPVVLVSFSQYYQKTLVAYDTAITKTPGMLTL